MIFELEKYKKNRVVKAIPFMQRLRALWRIITMKNFILVCYDLEDSPEGVVMNTKVLARTDFNTIADSAALHDARLMLGKEIQK